MHYVYYLLMANSQVYTGSTSDLKRRVGQHQSRRVITTKKYHPIRLIGYEAYALKSDAQRRERFMKTTEGKRLFHQQFRDILTTMRQDSSVG